MAPTSLLVRQLRETKKLLRDTTKHMEKRAIGRNIGRRGHEMIQTKNTASGHVDEAQDLQELDEGGFDEIIGKDYWALVLYMKCTVKVFMFHFFL